MYKTRIKQWHLDKNNKESEMGAIVRKRKQRADQGKESLIRVRDRIIHYEEDLRYCKRKRISVENLVALRRDSATPETVECFTPIPSRVTTPGMLAIPERILSTIRDYLTGSFESGIWVSGEDQQLTCRSINSQMSVQQIVVLGHQCLLACELFQRQDFQEAGRTLTCAFASIKQIILEECRDTLSNLFASTISICRRGRCEIALALFRQIFALGELVIGQGHPLPRICGWLASLESTQLEETILLSFCGVGDSFEKKKWVRCISRRSTVA